MITYNAAISACEKGQQWQLALGLLAEMALLKVDKDVITYNAAISACEKGHQWQLALGLLAEMALLCGGALWAQASRPAADQCRPFGGWT